MPPEAMASSEVSTTARTPASSPSGTPRASARTSSASDVAWGNLGAPPKPPWTGSCCAVSSATAPASASAPGPAGAPQRAGPPARGGEGDHPAPGGGREVGAAEERPAVGGEEHGHRPPALAGQCLDGLHVDVVDVGPLLPVDLDVDEQLVHQ